MHCFHGLLFSLFVRLRDVYSLLPGLLPVLDIIRYRFTDLVGCRFLKLLQICHLLIVTVECQPKANKDQRHTECDQFYGSNFPEWKQEHAKEAVWKKNFSGP